MTRPALLLFGLSLLAAGCPPITTVTFEGEDMKTYFPFGSDATSVYISEDLTLPYFLEARFLDEVTQGDSSLTQIYTFEFAKRCVATGTECIDGEVVFEWRVSSDSAAGTLLHGHTHGGEVSFDPVVRLTDAKMRIDDVSVSESGGATWSSTFVGFETCPAPFWRNDPPTCAKITLDDGGAGSPMAGTFWAAPGFQIVAFDIDGESELWGLQKYETE